MKLFALAAALFVAGFAALTIWAVECVEAACMRRG